MTQYIEQYEPIVAQSGLNTLKNTSIGGTLTVTGSAAFNGGYVEPVTSITAATATVTAAQSGSVIVLSRAAGIVVTLPTPVVGLTYTFVATTTVTSGSLTVQTDGASTFLIGSVLVEKTSDGTSLACFANGTSTLKIAGNGTTTGGLLGSVITVTCITATQWAISGTWPATGVIATPFA